ncbi:uncharacterized protein LOC143037703 [Oratosquilla oratoria]|uniref:uncharacterized protein LOC143037703 n=1 Tax=Oratosquilla oratoria TaxID=337810 RepID=UPI003F771147
MPLPNRVSLVPAETRSKAPSVAKDAGLNVLGTCLISPDQYACPDGAKDFQEAWKHCCCWEGLISSEDNTTGRRLSDLSTTIESEEPPDNLPNPPEIPLENSQILQNLQIKVGHLSEKQDVAEPLTDLLRKDHDFVWTPTCETAFKNLKSLLTNAPVLRAPDFQRPFLLQVDANDTCIGAALLQEHNEVLHAIAYYSKKLSPAQKNYSVLLERSFSTESEKLSQTVEV